MMADHVGTCFCKAEERTTTSLTVATQADVDRGCTGGGHSPQRSEEWVARNAPSPMGTDHHSADMLRLV